MSKKSKTLEKAGKAENIGLGIYRMTVYPGGVICLISALVSHGPTDEILGRVDIAIPEHAYANRIKYPPVRFYHFARPS